MSRFEYLSVLVSIVIALGITEVTISWGRLIQHRDRVKLSWLHSYWSLFTLFLMIQLWWGFWNFRTVETWSLGALLGVVAEAITLVLCALVLIPREWEADAIQDLHRVYLDNSRPFFLLGALLLAQLTVVDVWVLGMPLLHGENAVRAGGTLVALVAAGSRAPRVHSGIALLSLALLAGFLLEALCL